MSMQAGFQASSGGLRFRVSWSFIQVPARSNRQLLLGFSAGGKGFEEGSEQVSWRPQRILP